MKERFGVPVLAVSARDGQGIGALKEQIISSAAIEDDEPSLVGGLIRPGEAAVLVTPIDKAAPKGRLILPQQQTIRDLLEKDAISVVVKENGLKQALQALQALQSPPAIVITDSQVFSKVAEDTPPEIPMTSFSILFARQKGDLAEMVRGARQIERLKAGDRVLHRKFGEGTVESVAGSGSDARIVISFTAYGSKEFSLAIAPIVKIDS